MRSFFSISRLATLATLATRRQAKAGRDFVSGGDPLCFGALITRGITRRQEILCQTPRAINRRKTLQSAARRALKVLHSRRVPNAIWHLLAAGKLCCLSYDWRVIDNVHLA